MKPPRQRPVLHTALWMLAIWAVALSLESWFRTPGSFWAGRLPPQRLVLDGALYERDPALRQRKAVRTLPSSAALVRHWMVSYRRRSGGASGAPGVLHMARIQATGSGRANRLPIRRIDQWMGNLAAVRGCVIGNGGEPVKLLEIGDGPASITLAHPEGRHWRIPLWLLGLRGIEEVNCLWIGSDRRFSPAALQRIATAAR